MGAALVELSAPATLEVLGRADLAELCAKDLDITLAAAKRILAVTSPRARGARRDAREGRAGPAATFSRRVNGLPGD